MKLYIGILITVLGFIPVYSLHGAPETNSDTTTTGYLRLVPSSELKQLLPDVMGDWKAVEEARYMDLKLQNSVEYSKAWRTYAKDRHQLEVTIMDGLKYPRIFRNLFFYSGKSSREKMENWELLETKIYRGVRFWEPRQEVYRVLLMVRQRYLVEIKSFYNNNPDEIARFLEMVKLEQLPE